MEILLNDDQKKAVEKINGPLRIIAGPGSGKTRTIVSKISYLISKGLAEPHEILAISFSNKSANEIRDRISKENGIDVSNVYTYHGWCSRFLRKESEISGFSNEFTILDSSDSAKRITNLIKENDLVIEKKDALITFDKIAREEIFVKDLRNSEESTLVQLSVLWEKYGYDKRRNGQLDFNDLIIEVKKLLIENENLANRWKNKYKYIFIDEFQDTNNVQFEIIKSITDKDSNITVVGDPDQNIYSWRGANIELINNFNKWFPTAETIMLRVNYRSTPEIIESSNALIGNNKNRVGAFKSTPIRENGEPVEIIEEENDREEAYRLVRRLEGLTNNGYGYHNMAIIVRSSYKTRPVEVALNHWNIPYRVIGAMKFFDRREVKQVLSFLKFSIKQNEWNLLDVINEPPKKFGPQKLNKTRVLADERNISMWEFLKEDKDNQPEIISDWISKTNQMILSIEEGEEPSMILRDYLEDINYLGRLFGEPNRLKNVKEILKIIRVSLSKTTDKTIKERIIDFLNKTTLSSSSDKSKKSGEVNIITSHASKGTEFPVVFIFNLVEGHWPSARAIESGDNLEEERRVLYVAMTRAKERLLITTSNGWTDYNKEIKQSRFIAEIHTTDSYGYLESNIDKPRTPDHKWEELNSDVHEGQLIFHNTFGEGEIILVKDRFIMVKFNQDKFQEILIGHESYKIIK